jgi:hypothetical protein
MPRKEYVLPTLDSSAIEEAFDQVELLGFALCSPFGLVKEPLQNQLLASDFPKLLGEKITIYGYLVTRKETRTIKGDSMNFGTFLDQKGEFIDTTHFPQVAKAYPFRGRGIYRIIGRVVEEFGFYSMEVDEMYKEDLLADPRYDEPHKQIANQSSMINFLK